LTTPASAITLNRSLMRGHWLTTTRSPGPNRPRLWACRNRHYNSYSTHSSRVRPHGNHDNLSFDPNRIEAGRYTAVDKQSQHGAKSSFSQ
jgi:hypothetical protein